MAADHVVIRVRNDGESIAEPVEGFQGRRTLVIFAKIHREKITRMHSKGISNDEKTQWLLVWCFFCKCIGLEKWQCECAAETFQ